MISIKTLQNSEINPIYYGAEMKFNPSEEAKICLECPLPDCKKRDCPRFIAEKRKIKAKKREERQ